MPQHHGGKRSPGPGRGAAGESWRVLRAIAASGGRRVACFLHDHAEMPQHRGGKRGPGLAAVGRGRSHWGAHGTGLAGPTPAGTGLEVRRPRGEAPRSKAGGDSLRQRPHTCAIPWFSSWCRMTASDVPNRSAMSSTSSWLTSVSCTSCRSASDGARSSAAKARFIFWR